MDPALTDYIQNAKDKGVRHIHIRRSLIASGWDEEKVDKAINEIYKPTRNISLIEILHWNAILSPSYRIFDMLFLQPLLALLVEFKVLSKDTVQKFKRTRTPY